MAEKTYKYNSVCEREKPMQTNSRGQFIMHVLSCPTCQKKLPPEIRKDLDPKLSQIMAQREHNKELARTASSGKKEEHPDADTHTIPPDLEKKEPPVEPDPEQAELQKQFDGHMRDSPVFQGMVKSVGETKTDIQKLTKQLDGVGDQISTQIASLGDRLVGKTTGEEDSGEEVDAGEATEGKEAPGKVLSEEEEKQQQGTKEPAWGGGERPNPYGAPDKIPASMREGYQPGQGGGEASGEKVSSQDKTPPRDEEPPKEEIVQKGGGSKGTPDLRNPEELKAAKAWVAEQEEKMGGGKKTETEKKGEIPYAGDLTDIIKAIREGIDAWKGTSGGGSEDSFTQFARELVLGMVKTQMTAMVTPPSAQAGSVSIVQMDAIRNLLGTFFTGMKSMPKEEQKKLIEGLSETGSALSQTEVAEESIH